MNEPEAADDTVWTVRGIGVPKMGFGTFQLHGRAAMDAVRDAIDVGYRHLDTARVYDNEMYVGLGLAASGVSRSDVFVTSKIMAHTRLTPQYDPAAVAHSVHETLERMGTDYLDLLLLHWPRATVPIVETLQAMDELRGRGWIKQIGVSNFPAGLLRRTLAQVPVFCDQVEFHPFLGQEEVLRVAREHDLLVTAHTPLGSGAVFDDPTISDIAARHGRTPAQVALRWLIEHPGVAAIPMADTHQRRVENLQVLDFALTPDDRALIDGLPKNRRMVTTDFAPDWDD